VATISVVLIVLWLLGSVSSLTLGSFIHVFPAIAICMMLPRIIMGCKAAEF
jgi:hypothetical protein